MPQPQMMPPPHQPEMLHQQEAPHQQPVLMMKMMLLLHPQLPQNQVQEVLHNNQDNLQSTQMIWTVTVLLTILSNHNNLSQDNHQHLVHLHQLKKKKKAVPVDWPHLLHLHLNQHQNLSAMNVHQPVLHHH